MAAPRRKSPVTRTQALAAYLEKTLLPDLRLRAKEPDVADSLRERHAYERAQKHTAAALPEWSDLALTQIAVAWVLSAVFVRTLEDRGLLPQRRIAGGDARESERLFYELFPGLGARDYLAMVFTEVSHSPVVHDLLGPEGNPAWRLSPSHDAVRALLDLLRDTDAHGVFTLRFDDADTRFLGDLYQDLSAEVRERYALLQTPDFVESFILDRTLEPAIAAFPLREVRMLDPTCGSGHFLLGAFHRLVRALGTASPGRDTRELALDALGRVYGSDINPYAVAIARFRLLIAYLDLCGITSLSAAPALPSLTRNVVVADSLLLGCEGDRHLSELAFDADAQAAWGPRLFDFVDPTSVNHVFGQRYHAVVGNPPYIVCRDAALRETYRKGYPDSASGKFALAAPFTQRFFALAVDGGFVGLINANSFMKREFGKKLVEKVLPRLDLTEVIDTSGAFIPGHGTPTVILYGRNRSPQATSVRVVMGRRGEPETPEVPANGKVWSSIVTHDTEVGYEDDFITVAEVPRTTLGKHPWSLGGGGAGDLKELIEEKCPKKLAEISEDIGFASFTGLDEAFIQTSGVAQRQGVPDVLVRPMVIGESVRDWSISTGEEAITPYDPGSHSPLSLNAGAPWAHFLWLYRTCLDGVTSFGGKTRKQCGDNWWEWYRWQADRYLAPFRITFAFVATHNHFVLDRGGKVFNRSAPIIKLPVTATEDDHLALLAWLNSSIAATSLRCACSSKGAQGVNEGIKTEQWEQFLEYSGGNVERLRAPSDLKSNAAIARRLDALAQERESHMPRAVVARDLAPGEHLPDRLIKSRKAAEAILARMVSLQEELDWRWYEQLELLTPEQRERHAAAREAAMVNGEVPPCAPGMRSFERAMVLSGEKTTWFERNGYVVPTDAAVAALPAAVRALMDLRREIMEDNRFIALIERPEHKRRWTLRDFDAEAKDAATTRLLDRIEDALKSSESPLTASELVSTLLGDATVEALAGLCFPQETDPMAALPRLIADDSVAFLAALRHTETGLAKRARWEHTWALQRREDAGEAVGEIPVPPKYDREDYRDGHFWSLRGKLDVPRERFIAYPGAELDERAPLFGWAGWNHLQRARSLAALYQRRKQDDGWGREALRPLLAGLDELLQWLLQWHNDPDPSLDGMRQGEVWAEFLEGERSALGWSHDELRAWRPAARTRGGGAKKPVREKKPKADVDAGE